MESMKKKNSNLKNRFLVLALIVSVMFSCLAINETVYAAANNPTQAETMKFGKDKLGTFSQSDENEQFHYYKFTTPKIAGIDYTVRGTYTDEGDGRRINVRLMNDNYEFMRTDGIADATWYTSFSLSNAGQTGSMTYSNLEPGATYYVWVRLDGRCKSGGDSYAVCVKQNVIKPSTPVIKNIKPGKKQIKVSYYKTKLATRYQIQIKKSGGSWKTYNNGKDLNRTIKNLEKGKYYVRIRAQRKVNGKWYSSKWSANTKVKVK